MNKDSLKTVGRWSRDLAYVYIRPTISTFAEPDKKPGQYWVVSVQIRHLPPCEYRDEGRDLDEVIARLAKRVPRRKDLDKKYEPTSNYAGFLAPHRQWQETYKSLGGPPAPAYKDAPVRDHYGENKSPKSTKLGYNREEPKLKKRKKK